MFPSEGVRGKLQQCVCAPLPYTHSSQAPDGATDGTHQTRAAQLAHLHLRPGITGHTLSFLSRTPRAAASVKRLQTELLYRRSSSHTHTRLRSRTRAVEEEWPPFQPSQVTGSTRLTHTERLTHTHTH
ncbi:unnamed protein product [Leuciscus chuanchicus]